MVNYCAYCKKSEDDVFLALVFNTKETYLCKDCMESNSPEVRKIVLDGIAKKLN